MKCLVVAYDIADDRRRSRVAHLLEGYGERVQKSVFECELDQRRETTLRLVLSSLIEDDKDGVRIYRLCDKDHGLSLAWGTKGVLPHSVFWVL